eukprot:2429955-Rhodomonas_salina.2
MSGVGTPTRNIRYALSGSNIDCAPARRSCNRLRACRTTRRIGIQTPTSRSKCVAKSKTRIQY